MRTEIDHCRPPSSASWNGSYGPLEEFDEARSLATQEWKKKGRILKIILYGSYARGGWVDEPQPRKGINPTSTC